MKTRESAQQKKPTTKYFAKIFGCFFKHPDMDTDKKNDHADPKLLFESIQEDICYIQINISNDFENKYKLGYPIFKSWTDYFYNHTYLILDDFAYLHTGAISTIPEFGLRQLITNEKYILNKYIDQAKDCRINDNMMNLVNNFIASLEKVADLIHNCNDKILRLQEIIKINANDVESILAHHKKSRSSPCLRF